MNEITGHLPGGRIGFAKYDSASPLSPTIEHWRNLLGGNDWGFPCLRDSEFVEQFIQKVPSPEEQDKYVVNTSSYLALADRTKYDPKYVLAFRRSLPSDNP
jgi:hypothetical protein